MEAISHAPPPAAQHHAPEVTASTLAHSFPILNGHFDGRDVEEDDDEFYDLGKDATGPTETARMDTTGAQQSPPGTAQPDLVHSTSTTSDAKISPSSPPPALSSAPGTEPTPESTTTLAKAETVPTTSESAAVPVGSSSSSGLRSNNNEDQIDHLIKIEEIQPPQATEVVTNQDQAEERIPAMAGDYFNADGEKANSPVNSNPTEQQESNLIPSSDLPLLDSLSDELLAGQNMNQPLPTRPRTESLSTQEANASQVFSGQDELSTGPAPVALLLTEDTSMNKPTLDQSYAIDTLPNVIPDGALSMNALAPQSAAMSLADTQLVLPSLEQVDVEDPPEVQAFAKLSFPDGDFFVHTFAVELGRDVKAHARERNVGKIRRKRERRDLRGQALEGRSRMLENEHSQQLLPEDADMEGLSPRDIGYSIMDDQQPNNTAMSVSNFSEVGGIMRLECSDSDDNNSHASRRKKKKLMMRSSNSSHSVDPTTLSHANPQDLMQNWDDRPPTPTKTLTNGSQVADGCPLIPIHPQAGASFKGISRRHVRIEYNLEKGYWEMFVTGRNTVFHNNDRVETGESVRLRHGSEIIIQTITIIFKLPDNAREDVVEVEQAVPELYDSDSPLSELDVDEDEEEEEEKENVIDDDDDLLMDSSDDDVPLVRQKKRSPVKPQQKIVKIKLSLKNKHRLAQKFPSHSSSRKDKAGKQNKVEKVDKADKNEKTSKSGGKQSSKSNKKLEKPEKPEKKDKAEKAIANVEKPANSSKTIKVEKGKDGEGERVKQKEKEKPKDKQKEKSASISAPVPAAVVPAAPVAVTTPLSATKPASVTTTAPANDVAKTPTPTSASAPVNVQASPTPQTPIMPPPSLPIDVQASVEDEAFIKALQSTPGPSETSPAVPAELPAGSVLVGVAPEDIPAKRKGPGRPPKNGVMSKRDEAIIKRLTKDLQKQGKEVPSLNDLLLMARAEGGSKKERPDEKDGDMKMSLEGSATPGPVIDPAIMQSIEGAAQGTPQATSQATPDKDSKPKRVVRTPSPQKPESEYTEEELKKPTQTYVVLIHEALSKSSTGIMDLQQIYDAMQKMYPFFKYRAGTSGWQSSVRHNLISSDAFQEAGKIGKGRLWKINPDVSIDKEKKRKAPTPPPQSAPPYPYYPNAQYQYAPPQHGAQGYSGYPRPSPYGTPYGPPAAQPGARPAVAAPQQKPGAYFSPYASNPGAHASPYGPPSRAPYAAYPPQAHGQTPQAPPPGQSPYGPSSQPMAPNGHTGQQQGQPPASGGQPQQPVQNPQTGPGQPLANGQPNGQQNGQATQYQHPPNGQYPPPQNAPQQQQGQHQAPNTYQPQQQNNIRAGPPPQFTQPQTGQQSQPPPANPPSAPQPTTTTQPAATSSQQITGNIDIAKALAAIMAYQQQFVAGIPPGQELIQARGLFNKSMTRAISSASLEGNYESKAEEDLTKKIAEIYAQSRVVDSDKPQQTAPPPSTTTPQAAAPNAQGSANPAPNGPRYNSTHPTPSPAPSHGQPQNGQSQTAQPRAQPQRPVNTTPAPPQGNIPAQFLPPQYNPQAAGASYTATPHAQQQQGARPQRQGSASDAQLASALRAAMPNVGTPQPQQGTSGTPAPQYQQARGSHPPQQQQSPYLSRPASQAPGVPPQQQPGNPNVNNNAAASQPSNQPASAPRASLPTASSASPAPTPMPTSNPNAPPRPTFTPAPPGAASGQQGHKMPPRPTFAPSPAVTTVQIPAVGSTSVEGAKEAGMQNQGAGGSLKRPIEIDEEEGEAEVKRVKVAPMTTSATAMAPPMTEEKGAETKGVDVKAVDETTKTDES